MKITRKQLRRVIREELERHLFEAEGQATEAAAMLVWDAAPGGAVKMGTMKSALDRGDWDEVVRQGAVFGVTPESVVKDSISWGFRGGRPDVLQGQFDTAVRDQGWEAAVNWALTMDDPATIDSDVEQHVMAWVKENR